LKRLGLTAAILVLSMAMPVESHATVRGGNGRIAFRRYLNQAHTRGAIFTIRPDGTGERRLTHPRRGIITDEPDWSPNGRWIVYQVEEGDGFNRVFKIRRNGSDRTNLSTGCGRICGDAYPAWSPSGKRIALQRLSCGTGRRILEAVYVMRADGTHARRVTHKEATCTDRHRYEDRAPTWAPNRKRLAFERFDSETGKQALFTIRLDGTGRRRLTQWRINASQPDWSPNGRWIVFRTQDESETRGNIALVHPNGSGFHRITHEHGEFKWLSCSFSPNGKKIQAGRVPGSGSSENADIYVMNIDGSERRNVTTSNAWESGSDWGPRKRDS
jgi:TolB protein